MAMYQYVRDLWKKPSESLGELWKARLIQWRQEPVTLRLEYPTRIDRARSLGYKAKQGFVVVRQRLFKGGHVRPHDRSGRKPKNNSVRLNLNKRYQHIAEERAARVFPNLEVLNSYYVADDGKYYWYEIILVDKQHPVIKADKNLSWLASPKNRRRVFRGKTSAARKYRRKIQQTPGSS